MIEWKSLVDTKNIERFKQGNKYFVCTICGHHVTLDDSFSNQGKNLVCRHCVTRISELTGLDKGEILKLIWR